MFSHRASFFRALVLISLLCAMPSVPAQSLFQNEGRTGRQIGVGGAHNLASPDPSAAAWNPALLGSLREAQFMLSPDQAFNLSTTGVAAFWPGSGGFAASLTRITLEPDGKLNGHLDRLSFGWGKSLWPFISTGISVHGNKLNGDKFSTVSLGFLVHPFGGRLAYNEEPQNPAVFNAPLSPFRAALGFHAHDLALGDEFLEPYYSASLSIRTGTGGPGFYSSLEWQRTETSASIGLTSPIYKRIALYAGLNDLDVHRTSIGAAYMESAYSFDLVYCAAEDRWLGSLHLRLGASPAEQAQRHLERATLLASERNYRPALREFCKYRDFQPRDVKVRQLTDAISDKVAAEDKQIKELLKEAHEQESKHWYLTATQNYLRVLNIDRRNPAARHRLEALQSKVDAYINQLFKRGEEAFEEGNYEVAKKAFENILLAREDHREAADYLKRIGEFRKDEAQQTFLRGLGYYSQRNFGKAVEAFQQALEITPQHAEARSYVEKSQLELENQRLQIDRLMAEAQRAARRQQFVSAYKLYREVLSMDPDHEAAREEIRALQGNIDGMVAQRMQAGQKALQQGDIIRADREFQAALALAPSHNEARAQRDRIAEIKRSRVADHFRNALSLFESGEWNRAVIAFERVLDLDPSHKMAARKRNEALSLIGQKELFAKGREYFNQGRYYQAMEVFERLLAKDPKNAEASNYLENSLKQLNLKVEQHFNRGLNFYANEDYEDAIREWDQALVLNPRHTQSLEYKEQAKQKLQAIERLISP